MKVMPTFKDEITSAMTELGKMEKVVFLGEGLIDASPIYGTMIGVPKNKVIEFPIAENLIVGSAIGLALEGWTPIVVFQRMDFMLCAADDIINHLALIPLISNGKVQLRVILRTVLGSQDKDKFNVGLQHSKDLMHVFQTPGLFRGTIKPGDDVLGTYKRSLNENYPAILLEHKDDYNKEIEVSNDEHEAGSRNVSNAGTKE